MAQCVTPILRAEMQRRSETEMIPVLVMMKSQYDQADMNRRTAHFTTVAERRTFVVNELKQFADASQNDLRHTLAEMERQGMVEDVRILWICNSLYFKANANAINALDHRTDLDFIEYNPDLQLISAQETRTSDDNREIPSHITQVNADAVWGQGYTGQGVVVAVLDTGVNYNHLDLADHLWDGGPEFPNHGYDLYYDDNDPMDDNSHGTHCAGIVCGDGTAGSQTGVAPDATLMCVKMMSSSGNGSVANINNGLQWAIEHGADVISLSISTYAADIPMTSQRNMRNTCVNILNAGVAAAMAAGNEGYNQEEYPIPGNTSLPAACPPPYLDADQQANPGGLSCAISVGAVDDYNEPCYFTAYGPFTWQDVENYNDYPYNPGIGLIRPDVSAPGSWIKSLNYANNSGYMEKSGTSQATPAVAGCIALMLNKNPNLSPADICRILEETATASSRSKSNRTGYGRINAFAAVNAVSGGGITYYSINVSANPTNGGTVTGGGSYQQGQSCTVTATANTGYNFTNWMENGSVVSSNASYTFTVNGNRTLVANFTAIPQTYTVSVSANPTNGGTVTGGGSYQQGQSCTVTATANTGYNFTNWMENGSVVSSNASYTFTVNGNRTLVANFTAIPQTYTVSVSANPTNGGTVTGGGSYQQGQSCTVTATANTGYNFTNWTENGNVVSSNASYSFTVNANRTLVANFTLQSFTITATVDPVEAATVSGAGTYDYGETVTLSFERNEDYAFQNWTEDGFVVCQTPDYSFVATTDHNVVVHFLYTEGVDEQNGTIFAIYPNPANDKITIEAQSTLFDLVVVNMAGEVVTTQKDCDSQTEISLNGLSAGVYFVRLTTGDTVVTRKFMKK